MSQLKVRQREVTDRYVWISISHLADGLYYLAFRKRNTLTAKRSY
jgi:hypothetical protein